MTTQLPERLRELADGAPGAMSPDGLWREGRRRHRRRVASAVAVLGCLVAGTAFLGVGSWRSTQPSPAAPPATRSGPMSIPDRLFNPSPWLPGTSAPGRLVAVFSSTRDHFPFGSDRNAIVGVAAGSQTYRFLDLPGQSSENPDVALAPDGRHLAYWINGTPPQGSVIGNRSIVGIATIDLTTGEVERHDLGSAHGLSTSSLSWSDDRTIAFGAVEYPSRQVNTFFGSPTVRVVQLGSATAQTLGVNDFLTTPVAVDNGLGFLVGARRLTLSDDPVGGSPQVVHTSTRIRSAAFDVLSGRLAAVRGIVNGRSGMGRLVVGHVTNGGARLSAVPRGQGYMQVVAWVNASHVVAVHMTHGGLVYDIVDVRNGARRQLTSKPWYSFQVARDALEHAKTVPGIAPPTPWSPRLEALGGLLVVIVAGGVLLVGRRTRAGG